MKGVGSMRRLFSFIFAILIAVFAVMPNVYAEAQKDYGNLDMNRWVLLGHTEDKDVLIDKKSVDYYINYQDDLLCNFWVCHYLNNENKYILENVTISYNNKTISVDSYAEYDKKGDLQDSYTYPYQKFTKIIPGSIGEVFYLGFFQQEYLDDIKTYAKKRN